MKIKTFQKERDFIKESMDFISNIIKKNPKASVALSGGSTPIPIYKALTKKSLNFTELNFFEVDERYVPRTNPNSNAKMIYETLINNIHSQNFHYFDTSLSIKKSLQKYEKEITTTKFDLTILGIGKDGHTASLFPYSSSLGETKSLVAHTQTSEFKIKDRLTITFPKILESKTILILLKGRDKTKIINELKNPTTTEKGFPALKLTQHKNLTIHFCSS